MSRGTRKRALFVSYGFPPAGGAAARRVAMFAKYLSEFGWTPTVLTAARPPELPPAGGRTEHLAAHPIIRTARRRPWGGGASSPVWDGTSGRGAGGWAPRAVRRCGAALLQPDPQVLWWPRAVREGCRLLRESPHHVIVASGPPFSTLLIGAALSRRSRLPLVLDYCHEWDLYPQYVPRTPGWLSQRVQGFLQRRALRAADCVLATTPSSAAALAELAARAGSHARATWIFNGFDPEDFHPGPLPAELVLEPRRRAARFRLTYVGTLSHRNPAGPIVRAVRSLCQSAPSLAARLELVFAGRRTSEQEAELDQLARLPVCVTRLGFVPHDQAVAVMQDADALLLLGTDLPHTPRIVNAKTFPYLAARRPILAVVSHGDVWEILRDVPQTVLRRPSQTAGVAEALAGFLQRHCDSGRTPPLATDTSIYEGRHLSGELAVLLDELADDRPRHFESALQYAAAMVEAS